MELEAKRERVETYLGGGGKLAQPDTVIDRFDATLLAQAIEHEAGHAFERGQTHIRMNMPMTDAIALAKFLRRGAMLGA